MLLAFIGVAWGLVGANPIVPQTEAPKTLSQKEIDSGWIQLFDGETTFGWTARGSAQWKIENGEVQSSPPQEGMGMLATNTEFADFDLHVEAWIDAEVNSGIMIRGPLEGDISPANAYEINIFDPHPQWPTGSINNVQRTKRKIKSVGHWTNFDIHAEGDHLVVKVNGKKTVDAHNSQQKRGVIALQAWGKGSGSIRFRNIKVQPLDLKPIFNGKDLTGWKPLTGHPSVFSLTPEGYLNIKNGNGEIQSEGQWQDFVLQLGIYSNGDHLNSGVFLREDPNEFWSGYESQIRNQWEGQDRTKAVDFGTGGLYNRQAARKVVSSDREWFTMTVVAHGPHFGIWINGYQTTDFVDQRPLNQHGRYGQRLKGGVIGLQGHDPTTDLSFRNIRIQELPTR
jgi:hypothetical protein